jgi:hypothetical protein
VSAHGAWFQIESVSWSEVPDFSWPDEVAAARPGSRRVVIRRNDGKRHALNGAAADEFLRLIGWPACVGDLPPEGFACTKCGSTVSYRYIAKEPGGFICALCWRKEIEPGAEQ